MERELGQHFVMLCDWRGHCIWTSARNAQTKVGEFIWAHAAPKLMSSLNPCLAKLAEPPASG